MKTIQVEDQESCSGGGDGHVTLKIIIVGLIEKMTLEVTVSHAYVCGRTLRQRHAIGKCLQCLLDSLITVSRIPAFSSVTSLS